MFRAFVAVKCNGKSVHLVLYLRKYSEQFAVCLYGYGGRWVAIQQFVGAVAVVFGQSCDSYLQVQFVLHHASHHAHLSLSSIGDNQVGQWFILLHHSCVASSHHLFH